MKPLLIKVCATLAAVLAGGGLAILSPSSTAGADTSTFAISIQSPATLLLHGVEVSVPLVVNCPAGTTAQLSLNVYQAVGKRIALGSGGLEITCTGSPETILTGAVSTGVAFSKGHSALATAGLFGGCGDSGCSQATDSATIRIK